MSASRPRAQTDAPRHLPMDDSGDIARRSNEEIRDFASHPRRAATSLEPARHSQNFRRRSVATQRSAQRPTIASRTGFTLAGADDAQQLRTAHEAFVHPGYAELNPSYEQPSNARPVWSLAKPLPRVVRPGMIPSKEEILENRVKAELPAENSQNLGMDVDPNDLEAGKIRKSTKPAKISAQVKDARQQRENNFLNGLQSGALGRSKTKNSLGLAGTGSRRGRTATWAPGLDDIPAFEEDEVLSGGRPSLNDHHSPRPSPALKEEQKPHLPTLPERPEPEEKRFGAAEEDADADSMTTIGPDDGFEFPDDLQPLLDSHIEDEIHNNHTTWSVIRTHYREGFAELLAVLIQLTIGFSSDLAVTVANPKYSNTTDWAWGFAVMVAIYVSGGISGAHLNPVITCMLWFYRGFPKKKMPEYFLAQFIGAFIAALVAYGVYYASIQEFLATEPASGIIDSFVTSQRSPYIRPVNAFFNEFVATACLTATVLALGDDQNAPPGAGMNALILGFVIAVLSMAFGRQTGAALNPSRDFGPRLALLALGYTDKLFTNPYWFYGPWAGALSGAFVGAGFYDFLIFTGGESPINYPWSRTKRSFLKSKRKWARRLRLNVPRDELNEKAGQ